MNYQVLLKELEQNLQLGLTWSIVPVKSKMTLDPRILKLERFEFQDRRIKFRVWRIKFAPSISGCMARDVLAIQILLIVINLNVLKT